MAAAARAEWRAGLLGGCADAGSFENAKTAEPAVWQVYPDPYAATGSIPASMSQHAWVYKGQIWLDGPCWFAEIFDDGVFLAIDGETVLDNCIHNDFTVANVAGAGWHDVEIRFWNGSGGGGPCNNAKSKEGVKCGFGICRDAAPPKTMAACSHPVDPGDGTLFRCDDGTASGAALLIETVPARLPRRGFVPAGLTNGLAEGDAVVCSAPAGLFWEGAHYTNRLGAVRETWDESRGEWAAPETNGCGGTCPYTHGGASARLTWLYEPDAWRLDVSSLQPRYSSISQAPGPNFTGADGYYTNDTAVTLTAAPTAAGARFVAWRENGTNISTDAEVRITMDRPRTVRAVFETAVLTWAGGESGGVWRDGGGGWLAADGTEACWADGAEAVFTNGAAVFVAEGGVRASSLSFEGAFSTVSGGRIELSGAAPRIQYAAGGSARIDAPISASDTLEVARPGAALSFDEYITKTDQLIFPGVRHWEKLEVDAYTGGSALPNGMNGAPLKYTPCFETVIDERTRTIQYQVKKPGEGFVKCVKVRFEERADGVWARAEYAKYTTADAPGSFDFDTGGNDNSVATSPATGAYGVSRICARYFDPHERVALAGGAELSGGLRLNAGTVELAGGSGINRGIYTNPVALESGCVFRIGTEGGQVFKGPVAGDGTCIVEGAGHSLTNVRGGCLTKDFTTVASDARLARVADACARMAGKGIGAADAPGIPCLFRNDGESAGVFFLFRENGKTKCVEVEMKQDGADIAARVVRAADAGGFEFGERFENGGGDPRPVAEAEDAEGYGVRELSLVFDTGVSFFGECSPAGGIRIAGAAVRAMSVRSFPRAAGADIAVDGGGRLFIMGNDASVENSLSINRGGRAVLEGKNIINRYKTVTVDGGVLEFRAYSYMNLFTLKNGAGIEGCVFRSGYVGKVCLTVSGTEPSEIASGIMLVKNASPEFLLDVEDVTSDARADLTIRNRIIEHGGLYGLPVEKRGPGTVSIACPNSATGQVRIAEGAIRLDHAEALNSRDGDLCLEGGGLELGGFDSLAGPLTVSADSALDLAAGGTIAFKASSGRPWNPDAVLRIKGELGKTRVRFGTDRNGLSEGQLAQIRLDDGRRRVRISKEGYLSVQPPEGTLIVIR